VTIAVLEGSALVGGVSAAGMGLVSVGTSKDSVPKYETALETDKYLLFVHGTPDGVETRNRSFRGPGIALTPFTAREPLQSSRLAKLRTTPITKFAVHR
jgi:hypothetical protein